MAADIMSGSRNAIASRPRPRPGISARTYDQFCTDRPATRGQFSNPCQAQAERTVDHHRFRGHGDERPAGAQYPAIGADWLSNRTGMPRIAAARAAFDKAGEKPSVRPRKEMVAAQRNWRRPRARARAELCAHCCECSWRVNRTCYPRPGSRAYDKHPPLW